MPGVALADAAGGCPALLQHTFARLQDESPVSLCQFGGKVVMVVNTASFCGYTRQYEALEALHQKYRERGFVVIGFPSNDFGQQEPGSNTQIADFCRSTYGIRFPMFAKTNVTTPKANPFFDDLAGRTGVRPKWNFHKYLIAKDGSLAGTFGSMTAPDAPELTAAIDKALGA